MAKELSVNWNIESVFVHIILLKVKPGKAFSVGRSIQEGCKLAGFPENQYR